MAPSRKHSQAASSLLQLCQQRIIAALSSQDETVHAHSDQFAVTIPRKLVDEASENGLDLLVNPTYDYMPDASFSCGSAIFPILFIEARMAGKDTHGAQKRAAMFLEPSIRSSLDVILEPEPVLLPSSTSSTSSASPPSPPSPTSPAPLVYIQLFSNRLSDWLLKPLDWSGSQRWVNPDAYFPTRSFEVTAGQAVEVTQDELFGNGSQEKVILLTGDDAETLLKDIAEASAADKARDELKDPTDDKPKSTPHAPLAPPTHSSKRPQPSSGGTSSASGSGVLGEKEVEPAKKKLKRKNSSEKPGESPSGQEPSPSTSTQTIRTTCSRATLSRYVGDRLAGDKRPELVVQNQLSGMVLSTSSTLSSDERRRDGEIKRQVQQMIKNFITSTDLLDELPRRRLLNIRLFYTDKAPTDYETPCFKPFELQSSGFTLTTSCHEEQPDFSTFDSMSTGFHGVAIHSVSIAHLDATYDEKLQVDERLVRDKQNADTRSVVWDAEQLAPSVTDEEAKVVSPEPVGVMDDDGAVVPLEAVKGSEDVEMEALRKTVGLEYDEKALVLAGEEMEETFLDSHLSDNENLRRAITATDSNSVRRTRWSSRG